MNACTLAKAMFMVMLNKCVYFIIYLAWKEFLTSKQHNLENSDLIR